MRWSFAARFPESVQAVVHNGHVTLTGKVDWLYQKESAEKAVRHIRGVRGVLNHITVAPKAARSATSATALSKRCIRTPTWTPVTSP